MSSTSRTTSRTTSISKTNGTTTNNYELNESNEFDSRSSLKKNVSQYEGIYRNARFIHTISSGLLGQQVIIQTIDRERFHGILDTFSPNADFVLTTSHRLDSNTNDQLRLSVTPVDLLETIDSTNQTFELHKRIIKASSVVEILAVDVDLNGNGKCLLDEMPKVTQLEHDRFSRMQHFYDGDDVDSEALEELELTDDGKIGYDPEHMFNLNQQKFQTTTDYDESKYTNVPVPELSAAERAEIERKAAEIETGKVTEDVDEDDAGVKRPSESNNNETNSNVKTNRSYRNEFSYDNEYNSSNNRRGNPRPTGANNTHNRRGSGGNTSKPNSYSASRPTPTEQSNYNRSQQYNTRGNRSNRYNENRSSYEGRKSPPQTTNEESHRPQRMNSGNYSHSQMSGPTSPSTSVPTRTNNPSNVRSTGNRNSPAPYAGNSSSRTNSISTTSPPATTNKNATKSSRTNSQSATEEIEMNRPNRLSNNSNSANRPLQTHGNTTSNSNINTHDESEPINSTQTDSSVSYAASTGTITPNSTKSNSLNPEADEFVPVLTRDSNSRPESRGAATASPMSMTAFISSHHPQSAAAAFHLSQQHQQTQGQVSSSQHPSATAPTSAMIPPTHSQNPAATAAAFYPAYYPAPFATMAQYMNPATQQINVGMMPTSMMSSAQQSLNNASSSNTGSSSGMTTPNSSVSGGPTYKPNINSTHSGENTNNNTTGTNNVTTKKAVVSVQRNEQANASLQQHSLQQMAGAPSMIYSATPIRYYTPEYMTQQGNPQSMQVPQFPIYYSVNSQGLIQASGTVGQPPNIMIPTGNVSAGGAAGSATSPVYYAGIYPDPRLYYQTAAMASHWQMPRSPPQQQQQQQQQQSSSGDQTRNYSSGQTQAQSSSTGPGNNSTNTSRSASAASATNPPPLPTQYPINGAIPAAYAYGAAATAAWLPGPQIPSPQGTLPGQVNAPYNMMFDPSQSGAAAAAAQAAYVHPTAYETAGYYSPQVQQQQQQQQQQNSTQQNLDTVQAPPPGNYTR